MMLREPRVSGQQSRDVDPMLLNVDLVAYSVVGCHSSTSWYFRFFFSSGGIISQIESRCRITIALPPPPHPLTAEVWYVPLF